MNDRRAHFLTMLGDACMAAGVAGLNVEVLLRDGERANGRPSPRACRDEVNQADQTGYSRELLIDGRTVQLEDVVEFVICGP